MRDIEKNIYNDISNEILDFMSRNGVKYDLEEEKKEIANRINQLPKKDKEEIEVDEKFSMRIISLYNWIEKLVSIVPRKVYFSKHLSKKMAENMNEDIVNQINIFKKKFELGEDINSNLSKGIFNSSSWDYVLNIWNIRHLHLSESVEVEKSAMSKNRSDYLLFFVLKEDGVWFIDVRKHPRGPGFTSFEFLEILDESNWLNIIEFQELKDAINVKPVIEKEVDIYYLTKAGVNIAYEINGKYYINIMGITSLGNKSDHTFAMIDIRKKIRKFLEEDQIEYIEFKLLLNGCLGVIKYKTDSKEKQLIL